MLLMPRGMQKIIIINYLIFPFFKKKKNTKKKFRNKELGVAGHLAKELPPMASQGVVECTVLHKYQKNLQY
jgi:hypothetical protein